jgi:hypothetical protein
MKNYLRGSILVLFFTILLEPKASGSVLSDPGVPDGEQIVWRVISSDKEPTFSIITWRVKGRDGKLMYEITEDSGERKQAKYIIDKRDLRLIWGHIVRDTEDGKSEITIEVKDEHQYLVHDFRNKRKDKKTTHYPDGYNGRILGFSLRGFPFGKEKKVELRITPPAGYKTPLWVWKMWKSYARFLGEEKVRVPAGIFDCYKLEVAASGGLIKQFTSEYYFWFTKEPPHHFVKYEDEKRVVELMEIRSMGEK